MADANLKENRAERIKREKDGLDVRADIERYALGPLNERLLLRTNIFNGGL